jgi:hypothetical protein
VAFGVALVGLEATAPVACDEVPTAFSHGVKTEQSTTLDLVASSCEVTDRSTQVTVEKTVVNWSGLVAAIAGCAAAWLLGASLAGVVDRRRGLLRAAAGALVALGALVVLFL